MPSTASLIVVNYHSSSLAIDAIRTARAATRNPLQVIVVDNSVASNEADALRPHADILIAPYEAQEFFYLSPIKIFEYMAVGRAVVAAQVGQIREVIRDGVNGVVYDPSAPGALGERLVDLVDHPEVRRRLGEAARLTVENRYTWRANAEGVAASLEQAVERRPGRRH